MTQGEHHRINHYFCMTDHTMGCLVFVFRELR